MYLKPTFTAGNLKKTSIEQNTEKKRKILHTTLLEDGKFEKRQYDERISKTQTRGKSCACALSKSRKFEWVSGKKREYRNPKWRIHYTPNSLLISLSTTCHPVPVHHKPQERTLDNQPTPTKQNTELKCRMFEQNALIKSLWRRTFES